MSALPRHGHTAGYTESPEYVTWKAMIARCERPGSVSYRYYGRRGICVCTQWRQSFEAFLQYVGPKPSAKHSIERINRDGHYEPGNVRWATNYEQRRNLSSNHMVTISGETLCLTDWAARVGLSRTALARRLKKGMPMEDLLAPPHPGKKHSKEVPPCS